MKKKVKYFMVISSEFDKVNTVKFLQRLKNNQMVCEFNVDY